jgi:DNA-binding response OmpR family regulator
MQPKILVVEDEQETCKLLRIALEKDFSVLTACSVAEGLALAISERPEIALVDVSLPDGSGIKLCGELRNQPRTARTQVIILTGSEDNETVVDAFRSGADDFITKPFRLEELYARIGSKVQRIRESGGLSRSCGNLVLVPERQAALIAGKEHAFSGLEFTLLAFFIEHGPRIASRKQILRTVWPTTTVSDRVVDAHVVSLRKKLDDFDHEIVTVYGAGYTLEKKEDSSKKSAASGKARRELFERSGRA